jgi:beta-RFAP synthase
MMADAGREAVFVEAPARLHFGVLDLRGDLGRWFGGVGAAAAAPTLLVSGSKSERLEVSGEDPDRASAFAAAVLRYYGISSGVRLEVHRALPPHVGLGSGTQLALAVGRVIGELYGRGGEGADLARAAGRGRRSGIGTYIFDGGGLIVEACFEYASPAAVVVPTLSGASARRIAMLRLPVWTIAVSLQEQACRNLQFSYGVAAALETNDPENWNDYVKQMLQLTDVPGNIVLLTAGPSPKHPDANQRLEIIEIS